MCVLVVEGVYYVSVWFHSEALGDPVLTVRREHQLSGSKVSH